MWATDEQGFTWIQANSEAKREVFGDLGGAWSGWQGRSGKTNPIRVGARRGRGPFRRELALDAFALDVGEGGEGMAPVALGGLPPTEDLVEDVAVGGIFDEGGAEGELSALGQGGNAGVEVGCLDAVAAALHPDGLNHGVDEVFLDDGGGGEFLHILAAESVEFGGVFAGDDEGFGGEAQLE